MVLVNGKLQLASLIWLPAAGPKNRLAKPDVEMIEAYVMDACCSIQRSSRDPVQFAPIFWLRYPAEQRLMEAA